MALKRFVQELDTRQSRSVPSDRIDGEPLLDSQAMGRQTAFAHGMCLREQDEMGQGPPRKIHGKILFGL